MPTNTPTLPLPPGPASPHTTPTPILTPATATSLELVGHIGGASTAVFGQGKLLYFGTGAELAILDVSDPTDPWRVGYVVLPDMATDIYVVGNYAYLGAMYPNDLRVIDISDPTAPVEVGFYTPPADAREVAVAGSFAYVLDEYHSGLRLVDISDPTTPIQVDFYDLPNPSQFDGIAVANGYVYAGAGTAGLYILRHGSTVE